METNFSGKILLPVLLLLSATAVSQVAINTDGSLPHNSAMLDVSSTTSGILIPRMTQEDRDEIDSPAGGLLIFQTDGLMGLYCNAGTPDTPFWMMVGSNTGSGGAPPIGPAGGDLAGDYPDPLIGVDKVTSIKISDGTITSFDLAGNAITTEKIADHAVAVSKLPPGAAPDNFLRGDGAWAIPSIGSITEIDPTWDGEANLDDDIGRIGDVGIGTVSPTAQLHTNGTGTGGGNVLFVGEYKTYFPGDPPVEGAGTRMMWYPDQAVLRVGMVEGVNHEDYWDAANLGSFSTAIGYNCLASGSVSFSMGSFTIASNTCSVAIGLGTQSTAYAATALGYSTLASGYAATALGDNTIAAAYASTALGTHNIGNGGNTWVETDPIFEIGIGRSQSARKNAMTVLKNGHVGIGTPIPEAGLHVAAEGWPGSFVYLEADAGNDAGVRFYESTTPKWHIFNDASVGGLMIQNNATTPVIYCNQSNGYVGIRTDSPTQALHVVGDAYKTLGGNTWAASSDIRLKDLLGNYTKGLDEITALQPVVFVYKENNPRHLPAHTEQVGFVAQDVQKVFPEAVIEAEDGYLDFNIHAINVAMVNAVKELNNKVELQQKEIDDLKALVNSLIANQLVQNEDKETGKLENGKTP